MIQNAITQLIRLGNIRGNCASESSTRQAWSSVVEQYQTISVSICISKRRQAWSSFAELYFSVIWVSTKKSLYQYQRDCLVVQARLSSTRQAWSIFAEHRIELSRTEYYTIAVVKFRGTKDSTTSSLKGFVQASLSRTRQPWSSFAEHRTEQN